MRKLHYSLRLHCHTKGRLTSGWRIQAKTYLLELTVYLLPSCGFCEDLRMSADPLRCKNRPSGDLFDLDNFPSIGGKL
jgi:hypothetical protein